MKKILSLVLILVVSLSPARSQDTGPATTIPSDSNYKAHYAWNKACEDHIAAMKGKPCDIIFIGDSITAAWGQDPWGGSVRGKPVWEKYYANRNALNFGVGADTTQNVLWRFDNMDIKSFTPKVAVILIGTNNAKNTPADIAAGVKAVIAKTQQTFSGVKVILVSILPNKRANQTMMDTDAIIKDFADNQTIYYLDLVPLFTPVGDNWKGLGADHLHPDQSGYEIWASAMQPLLDKLLGGN
jgi:lysophospholipase L1-like esterase